MADRPITIIRNAKGWIDAAVIPPDQAAAMNEWLDSRGLLLNPRRGERLASDIERHYPGGLKGWSNATGCAVTETTA